MLRKIQLLFILFMLCVVTQAQKTDFDKQTVIHKVMPGQTVYSIARDYGLKPNDLLASNPSMDSSFQIKNGQIIRIEVMDKEVIDALDEKYTKKPIYYEVQPKETLYSIAQSVGVNVDNIKTWNKLTNNEIKIGQELIVGYRYLPNNLVPKTDDNAGAATSAVQQAPIINKPKKAVIPQEIVNDAPITSSPRPLETPDNLSKQDVLRNRYLAETHNESAKKYETGFAIWFNSENRMMNSRYYGLFSNAPIGSIVKVTNMMNNRVVYVKVIGRLPDTAENHLALIKLTPIARKQLIGNNTKVRVRVDYSNE